MTDRVAAVGCAEQGFCPSRTGMHQHQGKFFTCMFVSWHICAASLTATSEFSSIKTACKAAALSAGLRNILHALLSHALSISNLIVSSLIQEFVFILLSRFELLKAIILRAAKQQHSTGASAMLKSPGTCCLPPGHCWQVQTGVCMDLRGRALKL